MARPANLPGTERKANRASKRGADLQRRFISVGVSTIIAGTVEGGSGTVLNGTGFTCSAQSGSDYTVTFDAAVAAVPVVLAGHGGGASVVVDPTTSVPAWGASTTGFSVTSPDADDWSFVAVVP